MTIDFEMYKDIQSLEREIVDQYQSSEEDNQGLDIQKSAIIFYELIKKRCYFDKFLALLENAI